MTTPLVPFSPSVANDFAIKWKTYTEEEQWERTFWHEFFRDICGISDYSIEGIEPQKKVLNPSTGNLERIDLYWRGVAIVEHKSADKSLEDAEVQARRYWQNLPPSLRPPFLILCNFRFMRIVEVKSEKVIEFPLIELGSHVHHFESLSKHHLLHSNPDEIAVDQQAAKLMADIFVNLEDSGYDEHSTSVLLVRMLFLLFGDDTRMWKQNAFKTILTSDIYSNEQFSTVLEELFSFLDTEDSKRSDEKLQKFQDLPYINGGLFKESIKAPKITQRLRKSIENAANYDWGSINPTIFGALFQLIRSKDDRSQLGEHYTTEENIQKIIGPLFLDEIRKSQESAWDDPKALRKLLERLHKMKFFDPACGCGNFLLVTYKRLRQIELEIQIRVGDLEKKSIALMLDGSIQQKISIGNFYGMEISEWPAQVARIALLLAEHQENLKFEAVTGLAPTMLPINDSASIIVCNALRASWQTFCPVEKDTYILGNPPFVAMSKKNEEQQEDSKVVFEELGIGVDNSLRSGRLDYVACWFAKFITEYGNSDARCAFVSTNSLLQGEQARSMGLLLNLAKMKIDFAHKTFLWRSDTRDAASVLVIVVGISNERADTGTRVIYEYAELDSDPISLEAKEINAYLLDSTVKVIQKHAKPLVKVPKLTEGNRPQDGGGLIVEEEEYKAIIKNDEIVAKYIRKMVGSHDMLNGINRYCLWLTEANPKELKASKFISERLKIVAKARLESPTDSARAKATTPHLFLSIRQPKQRWLCVPRVSSENRPIIPMQFFGPEVIPHDTALSLDGADDYLFGLLQSGLFTSWVRTVAGRLGVSIRVSPDLCYNSFPFPSSTEKQRKDVSDIAVEILNIRAKYSDIPLGDLYKPGLTPVDLQLAHKALNRLVDSLFGLAGRATEAQRLAVLFDKYGEMARSV
jgi:type I restriction-modification system DNA methylase subunit